MTNVVPPAFLLSMTNTITWFQKERGVGEQSGLSCLRNVSWISLNCQNKAIQRSALIGMVYNSRQLLYIQKSHNTGNTGGLVYVFPWSNGELANFLLWRPFDSFLGSYCTNTRNEMLAKNANLLATCYKKVLQSLTVKNSTGKLLKSSGKWPGTLWHTRVPMIPLNSINTIRTLGQDCGAEMLANVTWDHPLVLTHKCLQ